MSDAPVRPGDIVMGKYRVDRVLGAGGMGVVVAATHLDLARQVALKFMLPGKLARPEEQMARFVREARASVGLKSQHVARVLDVGVLDGGLPYLVMELLDGLDLASVLEGRGPLPVNEAVEYVLQACEAVAEAHARGIIHRDLKPANLFLTTGADGAPCVKVIDFGVSKHVGSDLALTEKASALGSPLYMSPEQMSSARDVDVRSDLWSLGVILYELVAGRTPFHGDTVGQLCTQVMFGPPRPLTTLRAAVPAGFEAIVLHCLEKDRTRRFANVAELAAALAPYATARAAVYSERVANVLGVPVQPSRSTDLLPPEPAGAAPAGAIVTADALAATAATATEDAARTLASEPDRGGSKHAGSAAIGSASAPPREAPGARTRGLLVLLAVFAVAAPLTVFVVMRDRGAGDGSTADPGATAPSAATAGSPSGAPRVTEPAAEVSAAGSATAAGSSPPMSASASATPRARAAPAGGRATPAKGERPSYEGPRR